MAAWILSTGTSAAEIERDGYRVVVEQFSMTQCPMTSSWLNHFWRYCLNDGENIKRAVDFRVHAVGGKVGGHVTNETWNTSFHGGAEIVADKYGIEFVLGEGKLCVCEQYSNK